MRRSTSADSVPRTGLDAVIDSSSRRCNGESAMASTAHAAQRPECQLRGLAVTWAVQSSRRAIGRAGPAQHLPCLGAGVASVLHGYDAVHEHPLDAGRELHGLLVRRAVLKRVEIENRDVGPVAFFDHAPIG